MSINAIYKLNVLPIMHGDSPVLTERKDIKVWKRLMALEKSAAKGSVKNVDKLRKVIQDVQAVDGYVNPKIIAKVIDLVDIYLSEELRDIMLEILEKCKLTDCAPQLQAASKLVGMGEFDSAKLILDRMTVVSDVPQWEYLRGVVDRDEGNTQSAFKHFRRVYNMDDRFMQVYPELEQLDPDGGWFCRGMIASIMNDDAPQSHVSSDNGRYGDLYNAYWEWKNGDETNALDILKRMVREGIETDVELAMARYYKKDKKFQESIEHYLKAADSGIYFIKLELADAYRLAGNYQEAMNVCIELESIGMSDRRLIEMQILIAVAMEDRVAVSKYVKIYLYNDYADFDAYVNSLNAYIGLRMHSEASGLLEELDSMYSSEPMVYLLSSKNDYSSGRYPTALRSARKAIRKMPKDVDCQLHISRVYMSRNNPDKALKYVDSVLGEDDRNRDALLLKKDIFMNSMQYEKACSQCELIIDKYPDDTETMKDLAALYAKMGDNEKSVKCYEQSLDIKEDPVLFMSIITSLAKAGDYDNVIHFATKYEGVYGNIVDMWAIRGNAEYQSGRYDEAIGSYAKAVEMDHNKPIFWHSKGMAEEMKGDYDLAEISYDKAVLMDLDNPEYWISKAAVQEKKGDYAGAINSLNRVISTHPENVYSLMRKAMILIRLGKDGEARTFIELASKIEPNNPKIMMARRDIYCKQGDTEATKAVCKNILATVPNDKRTAIIMARMQFKTGELDEAHATLVPFLTIGEDGFTDDDYEIHQILREIYHTQGKSHEEISICKTILGFRPDDRTTKAALAEAYIKRGMIDAAKALYDELHLQSPDDSDFSLKKAQMADNRDAALSILMESLTTDPDNKDVLLEIATMLRDNGRYKDALVYADRAKEIDATDSAAYVIKVEIYSQMGKHRLVLETAEEAISNVRGIDPAIWKYCGDTQMILGDYSRALISYDTAMKLGINNRDIYHSRGMCQEALGMDEAAINSYILAYQKDPMDTDSMIREAAVYLKQEKDQLAGKILDKAISVDPLCSVAIIARATIYASKGNENGVKRMFDHCVTHEVDDDTKQTVADLVGKAKDKEVVALPVIKLEMPEPSEEIEEETEPSATEVEVPEETAEEAPEEATSEEEPEAEVSEDEETAVDEVTPEIEEEPKEVSEAAPEEEELEDGFVVEGDSDTGFVIMAPDEEEVEEGPAAEEAAGPEETVSEPVAEVMVESEAQAEEQASEVPAEEIKAEAEEPKEEPEIVAEEPEVTVEEPETEAEEPKVQEIPEVEEEVSEGPAVAAEGPEVQAEEQVSEVPAEEPGAETEEPKIREIPKVDDKSVEEYALILLEYVRDQDDVPSNDKIAEMAGIPADRVDEVFSYLSDIDEYGTIVPSGSEFERMEKMSYEAIISAGADDIEEEPVLSLTSAFYQSGAKDIDTAKRLVAYVYCALTENVDKEALRDKLSDIADDVEFNGEPNTVFGIMSKYKIGVYSAKVVKSMVFNKDGSVIGHI